MSEERREYLLELLGELQERRPNYNTLRRIARGLGHDPRELPRTRDGLVELLREEPGLEELRAPPGAPEPSPGPTGPTDPPAGASSQPEAPQPDPGATPSAPAAPDLGPPPSDPHREGALEDLIGSELPPPPAPAPAPSVAPPAGPFRPVEVQGAPCLVVVQGQWLLGEAPTSRELEILRMRAGQQTDGLAWGLWQADEAHRSRLTPWADRPPGVGKARADKPRQVPGTVPAGTGTPSPSRAAQPRRAAQPVAPGVQAQRDQQRGRRAPHPAHALQVSVVPSTTIPGFEAVLEYGGRTYKSWGSTPAEARTKAEAKGLELVLAAAQAEEEGA